MEIKKENKYKDLAIKLYTGTKWEEKAIAAGVAMDNRMNHLAKGPYGSLAPSSIFDMEQYLAWFDYEVIVRRELEVKLFSEFLK